MTEDQDVFRPAEYAWGDEPGAGAQGPGVPASSAPGASGTGASGTGDSGTGAGGLRASVPASSAPVTPRPPAAHAMPGPDIDALYQVVAGRRDVRNGFLPDPVAGDVLTRVLTAAHQAPSVGLSQPWDFIVLRDRGVRERVHALARHQQELFAAGLPGARARAFSDLKVEAILDTPLNIVVTCDPTRGGRHVLGLARPAAGRVLLDRVRGAEPLARRAG